MRLPTWSWLALTGLTLATSNSTSYTDPATNIAFQRWCDEAKGLCFGISLPETVATDFIGQLTVPLSDGKGWGGVSLSGSMTSSLLIAAWPNGDSGMGSLRKTTSYTNPGEYTDASMLEIPDGVAVNNTHLTYTFLCKGCVVGAPTTFEKDSETYVFGWALSKTSPTSPGSSAAVLPYHAAGFGTFEMLLGQAKSAKYGTWAGKAKAKTKPSASASVSASISASASATPSPRTPPKISNATYDYIVVGGGAAGLIAAERLAETKQKVLLLERGGPSTASMGADNTLAWNTSLTPHDVPALGSSLSELGLLGDYLCPDTAGMAGCVLGGSTIINALAFVHPQSTDFDKWPAGWKWPDVAAAAKRLYERNPGSMLPSADGKLYDQSLYGVLSSFLNRLGWKSIDQQAQPDEKHMAYSYPSWSVADGIRAGPVRSYLPLAQGHDNFTLRLRTKVRRVVRRGGRVTGVEVETASDDGLEIIHVRAGGKVILAGGALSTPRILFNSGIGPAKQLQTVQGGSTGTTLPPAGEWIDLPVGENLRDHPMFTVTVDSKTNITAFNTSSVIPGPGGSAQRLYGNGSGVLTEGGHRLQFWTSNEGSDGITRFYQGSCSANANGAITMKLYLMHGATSSGVLGIDSQGSTTIETEPWLQTQADREAASAFLRDLVHDLHHSPLGFSVRDFSSVADVLDQKTSGDHYVGTAMMGAVVDADARVYGTENLFVVDASIHPDLPTGNTQAIVMIVAEAAVDRIRSVSRARVSMSPSPSASASASASAVYRRKPVRTPAMRHP